MKVRFAAGITLALACGAAFGQAQNFPSKPMRFISTFPPGATTDILCRIICQKMAENWGQPCVVENRAGATGMIAAEFTAKSPADGYTFVNVISTHAVFPYLFKKVPFHHLNDFTPIMLLAQVTNILIVHPSVPVKNVKEFIAFANGRKGDMVYATSGSGSSNHLTAELFKRAAGIQMQHIPYKGGAPAVVDLVGGQVPAMMASFLTGLPHVKSGKARAVAVTSAQRQPLLPDVPTMSESGFPGFEGNEWWAALGPAGIPKDITAKLNGEMQRILTLPDVKERLTGLGISYLGGSPGDLDRFLRNESEKWAKLIKEANITTE